MHVTPELIGQAIGYTATVIVSGVAAFKATRANAHVKQTGKKVDHMETRLANVEASCTYPTCGHVCAETETIQRG